MEKGRERRKKKNIQAPEARFGDRRCRFGQARNRIRFTFLASENGEHKLKSMQAKRREPQCFPRKQVSARFFHWRTQHLPGRFEDAVMRSAAKHDNYNHGIAANPLIGIGKGARSQRLIAKNHLDKIGYLGQPLIELHVIQDRGIIEPGAIAFFPTSIGQEATSLLRRRGCR